MQVMKGNYGKDLNILSDQLGKDAVSRVHRLELENQRLQRELEAAKTDRNKIEKEAAYEFEMENKKVQASISRLEEQVGVIYFFRRDFDEFIHNSNTYILPTNK